MIIRMMRECWAFARPLTTAVAMGLLAASPAAQAESGVTSMGMTQADGSEASPELIAVLNAVPVFYLVHAGDRPVTLPTPDGARVTPVFFHPAAAESMREEILAGPAAPEEAIEGVKQVGLGEMYQIQAAADGKIRYLLIANPRQVENAERLLGEPGFTAVPLFAAKQASKDGFIAMRSADQRLVVPVFFEAERVEHALGQVVKADSSLEGDVVIEVMALDELVNGMYSGQLPLDQVQLIPSWVGPQ
jgi:hypothetical protein